MKAEEIINALRCISIAGGENDCEHCPYWREENVPEELRPVYGADTMHSCDIDRVGLDGADAIEKLLDRCARYAEEIAVLQERARWIPVTERLPGTEGRYIVRTGNGSVTVAKFYPEYGRFQRIFTHWLPLPAGPEAE